MPSNANRGRPPHPDILTPGEWRVAEAVRHGLSNPQIAALQGVSLDAVKYHVTNILQKLGLPSRRALRHWNGVRRDSRIFNREQIVEAATTEHMQEAGSTFGTIGQVSRSVKDIEVSRLWYADVLGLQHLYSFGKLAFFDCAGLRLFLSEGETVADSILYFSVPDIHASQAELAGRGVEFINAPHMIHRHEDGTEEWMAFFKDNEGRPLGLMSRA